MRTITFYSYKGGVGRTLAVTNVAKYLARLGKKVFVVDIDLEAPGLHYKFEMERGEPLVVERGLLDVLTEFRVSGRLPESLEPYVVEVAPPAQSEGTIHLLPAGAAPSPGYWKKLSGIDWHRLFYAEDAQGIPLFLELKARIEDAYQPDYLLIDARTGITEMGGVATTILSDQVVCLMLDTREHLEGTRAVMRAIQAAPRMEGAEKIGIIAVLSRVLERNEAAEQREAERVLAYLNEPAPELGSTLDIEEIHFFHREPMIEEREQILIGSKHSVDESMLLRDYLRLFTRLIPSSELEGSIGKMIEDIQRRAFKTPDDAEQSLEALTRYCLHPDAYRALLEMYRLRRTDMSKILREARTLWSITGDSQDSLLWEIVKSFKRADAANVSTTRQLEFLEAIWRANGANHSELALELASVWHERFQLAGRAREVLEVLIVETERPMIAAVVKLLGLLRAEAEWVRAYLILRRFKESMSDSVSFLEAWAELVLQGGPQEEERRAILDDPQFNLSLLRPVRPNLVSRLHLFCGNVNAAVAHFQRVIGGGSLRGILKSEVVHLGALGRDINRWTEFATKLNREFSVENREWIFEQIKHMSPALPPPPPSVDDYDMYGGNDDIPF